MCVHRQKRKKFLKNSQNKNRKLLLEINLKNHQEPLVDSTMKKEKKALN